MTWKAPGRWLGRGAADPGCDAMFAGMDPYAETVARGGDATTLHPRLHAHLEGCDACREDTEGLVAALRRGLPPRAGHAGRPSIPR